MAWKNAGGRYSLTGSWQKLTGSLAAYLNRPIDPRLSFVELLCILVIAAGTIGLSYALTDPPGAARFRLVAHMAPPHALGAGMGTAAVVYLALLFLVELPSGARFAGALLGAAAAGAAVEVLTLARVPPAAVLAGLVLAPAAMFQLRCRAGWLAALGASATGAFLLAILQDYLR